MSSAGVSELMDAEKKASTVVAEARAARSDRLKAAKAEAGAAVDDLRAARESEHALTTSSDSDAKEAQAIAATADAILAHVKRIAAIFDERLGALGPDLAPLLKLAHDIARRIPRREAAAEAEAVEEAAAPAPVAAPAPAAAPAAFAAPARPGAIESPADVTAALDRICDYYARKEPSSPLPLILKRARRLVSADFLTVIRDLAPLGLENVSLVGGISAEAEAYADYED